MLRMQWALLLLAWTAGGCLSNSYVVKSDELVRLANTDPQERWQSVRAVQRIGGNDDPPPDDTGSAAYGGGQVHSETHVAVVIVPHSHHHHHEHWHSGPPPPPRSGGHSSAGSGSHTESPTSGGSSSHGSSSKSSSKGNASEEGAIVVAAAVVTGVAIATGLAVSEGARYDGWVSVHPEEPLHLKLNSGRTQWVPLSALTPDLAAGASSATIYEGEDPRFPRLGRAPLNRAGFTMSAAFHLGGIPQVSHSVGTGLGGYCHIGGNIANIVTLGAAGTVDGGVDTQRSILFSTVGPEIQLFPVRYFGLYGGAGLAFRNTHLQTGTRADQGWLVRGGLVGEIPLSTRLALQARVGVARYDLGDSYAPLTWEGLFGFAVY
jgi:hypothetical protein